jgi:peptide deformylase
MIELMHEHNGVGLAGPQVGICRRIFVANPTGEPENDCVYINPELSDLTGMVESDEGCLSIPEVRVNLKRAKRCRVRAMDATGAPIDITAEDLLSRIVQHETDHLNGRLIIDAMDSTDKIANKKQLAQLEADYRKV